MPLTFNSAGECTTGSRLICEIIKTTKEKEIEKALEKTVSQLKGAFCLVVLTENKLIGVRDAQGFRPLVLGSIKDGFVLASEDCAFPIIGAQYLKEVQPGEMVVIENKKCREKQILPCPKKALCIFEHVYLPVPIVMFLEKMWRR